VHQLKLSARVQNEKKSDSTICQEEFRQQKLSVRVQHENMRESTICEKDTQKLSEVEAKPCEKTFLSNIIISSSFSFDVMQVHEENEVIKYDQRPIFYEDQVMAMDKGAEISLCLQHKDQIEGNNSNDATSVAFEDALVHGSFTTLAAPLTLQNLLKYDT
jgi:hypothetical protein